MSLKRDNTDTQFWDSKRGIVHSYNGGWIVGEGAFAHGHSIMDELVGKTSYFQLMILNTVGTLPERRLADWLEAVYQCLSWPDPRIWCNQIGALGGGTQTSVVAATVAGILAADSSMYGSKPLLAGVSFIQNALKEIDAGVLVEDLVEKEILRHRGKVNIMGYARPLASGDERVIALMETAKSLEFITGSHVRLALAIEKYLLQEYQESMNVNGYVSAFLSDQGFSAEVIYRLCALCISSGISACYIDVQSKPPESFLPLRCDDIDYQGKPPRQVE